MSDQSVRVRVEGLLCWDKAREEYLDSFVVVFESGRLDVYANWREMEDGIAITDQVELRRKLNA